MPKISLQIAILRAMTETGEKPHIPSVFHAAKHKKYCYMVMTLLGENLKSLKLNCPKELMSPGTWSRIAVSSFSFKLARYSKLLALSVKLVHDYGYVHRDIKPNNFVMGHRDDLERARISSHTRFWTRTIKNGKWVARRARGSAEFRGTLRYCSPNVHEKKEQ
ncbi:hypothetical protein COOONC_13180, partial [Cooperia oncophora]